MKTIKHKKQLPILIEALKFRLEQVKKHIPLDELKNANDCKMCDWIDKHTTHGTDIGGYCDKQCVAGVFNTKICPNFLSLIRERTTYETLESWLHNQIQKYEKLLKKKEK